MNERNICFRKQDFYLYFFLLVCVVIYLLYIQYHQHLENLSNVDLLSHLSEADLRDKVQQLEDKIYDIQLSEQVCQIELNKSQKMLSNMQTGTGIGIQNALMNKIYNPLVAPDRYYTNPTNLEDYQMIGYMYNDNTKFPLFGRYKFPGRSDKWEYYILDESRNKIKIPFKTKNDNELYDGDIIDIPTAGNGLHAKIYDYEQYRYNPNVM